MPILEHEHVFRLEVAVDDSADVCRLEAAGDLRGDCNGFGNRQWTSFEEVAKRLALQQFGDRVGDTIAAGEIVNRENIGVCQRRHRTRFALEARDTIRIGRDRGGQHLDGNVAP